MLSKRRQALATEILKSLFIFLFLYTAISKFIDFRSFNIVLSRSPLIGHHHKLVAILLPSIEIVVAALLFFPRTARPGLWAFLTLMVSFTIYIIYMLVFSPYLPCSCGGVIKYMSWSNHLLFNLAFVLMGLTAIILNRSKTSFGTQKNLIAQ